MHWCVYFTQWTHRDMSEVFLSRLWCSFLFSERLCNFCEHAFSIWLSLAVRSSFLIGIYAWMYSIVHPESW